MFKIKLGLRSNRQHVPTSTAMREDSCEKIPCTNSRLSVQGERKEV